MKRVTDPEPFVRFQTGKYGCASCPISCGGICEVSTGKYPVGEVHKPEYETTGAFGPLCLCDDVEAIIKLHDLCNRSGLDTISAGHVLAFAMECFAKGVLTEGDTDGLRVGWGDGAAMVFHVPTSKIMSHDRAGTVKCLVMSSKSQSPPVLVNISARLAGMLASRFFYQAQPAFIVRDMPKIAYTFPVHHQLRKYPLVIALAVAALPEP